MSAKKTHYQILELSPDVTSAEIKRAYRRLAKAAHPDAHGHVAGSEEGVAATEHMMQLNEAYSTLMDKTKRAEYDLKIGVKKEIHIDLSHVFTSLDEDRDRERFLQTVFYPIRTNISKLLAAYKRELKELSADPYDDRLIEAFQAYTDKIEDTLRDSSNTLTRNKTPRSLEAAVLMMRQCIAQASDGLDELRYYLGNYDYNHLTMAESLFRISNDLSRQALGLTKVR